MRIRELSLPVTGISTRTRPARAATSSPLSTGWVRRQFQRTDDGAGGRLQTFRRGVKFWVRCLWSSRALRMSTAALRDSGFDAIAESRPEIALRPLRGYLRKGLGSVRRAEALRAHFDWLAKTLPEAAIERLYAGMHLPLSGAGLDAIPGLGVVLSTASGMGREGELALHLEWQGQRAMSMAFSVLDARHVLAESDPDHGGGARLVIGTLQGARGAETALREISAAAQRLRPSALLVLAVQALSSAWGLRAPLAIAVSSHVYAGYASRRRKVALDYDAAWRDAGGERRSRHYWTLPGTPVLRPDAEIESRRRAQHRRRGVLRETVLRAVREEASRLVRSEAGVPVYSSELPAASSSERSQASFSPIRASIPRAVG